jgi:DNA-binding response OmpR family regulator
VPDVLVASDSPWVHDDLRAVLEAPGTTVRSVRSGAEVRPAVEEELPDLVVLDLQIGNMGAMAVCVDLRLEEGAGRLDHVPVLLLLDRRADVFMARHSGAEGWLVKPLDPIRLRRAAAALLDGARWEDPSYRPQPVAVAPPGGNPPAARTAGGG